MMSIEQLTIINKREYKEYISSQGLSYKELTRGRNGYSEPADGIAAVGFESYEQAKEFALKVGGSIELIEYRYGQQLPQSRGEVWGMIDFNVEDLGDNYSIFDPEKDWDSMIELINAVSKEEGGIKNLLLVVTEIIANYQKCYNKYRDIDPEKEIVVMLEGQLFDVFPKQSMRFDDEGRSKVSEIAVVKRDYPQKIKKSLKI